MEQFEITNNLNKNELCNIIIFVTAAFIQSSGWLLASCTPGALVTVDIEYPGSLSTPGALRTVHYARAEPSAEGQSPLQGKLMMFSF